MNASWSRNAFIYLLILVAGAALFFNVWSPNSAPEPIGLTELANLVRRGDVDEVAVRGQEVRVVRTRDEAILQSRLEPGVTLTEALSGFGVSAQQLRDANVNVLPPGNGGNWAALLLNLLPLILIVGFVLLIFRQTQGSNNQALSFGKSKARVLTGDKPTVTFDDVAGAEEAKQELQEVVEFLKEPQKFAALGARIPKGVLLVGPPGTGKTLMAKAVSGEAGVPFFSISGSEFVEMFVGVGASRVRDLFEQAKRNSPLHHLHRRNRRRRSLPRHGLGRLARRARADAQPDSGRDGRLWHGHQRDSGGRHQPAGHSGPGAAAPRSL